MTKKTFIMAIIEAIIAALPAAYEFPGVPGWRARVTYAHALPVHPHPLLAHSIHRHPRKLPLHRSQLYDVVSKLAT